MARGHAVRMLAWPALREAVENRGCTYVPFNHAPVFDRAEKERMEEKGPNKMAFLLDHIMFGPASAYARDVLEELEGHAADVAAIDMTLPGALCGAEVAGIPRALLLHSVYLYPAPGLPAFGMGFLPARTWLGRTRDAVMRAVFDRFMARGLRTLNEAREELELGSLSRLDALSGCAHRVLVMTSRAYDFEADELPPNVRYVGPQLETVTPGRWKSPWPPSDTRPLVLVGLSTDQMGQVPLLRNLIRALDELDVRALVTTGPGIDPTIFDTPNDVAIRQFVPHQDVMPEADLVITHAGHGTVIRALAAGVPMICIPLGRDQYDVAARVVWRGAGCKLSSRAGSKAISRRVASVLEDRRYGEVARELSASISRETRQNLAVLELETLGANKTSGGDIH
ncbi:MAG: glycosyltransferase [Deltaproteobacteria bacterium]|nr:glycosyltransferase [Deltaproteobacteria bacterium]